MKRIAAGLLFIVLFLPSVVYSQESDRQGIIDTNLAVRQAFAASNIEEILRYHHTDVEKVLAWNDYQRGHEDMAKALGAIFANFELEFVGSAEDMDSLVFSANTAIMIATFTVKGTPRHDGFEPFTFSGRTMIVYIQDSTSPTGWLTLREMIMPAQNE